MDNLWLYDHRGGSVINVGSFLELGDEYSVGDAEKERTLLTEGAGGGGNAYDLWAANRTWRIPLILPSRSAFGGLYGLQRLIRDKLNPDGYLEFKPQSVPTDNMLRFEIEGGELAIRHFPRIDELGKARALLTIYTQPYGYIATKISLSISNQVEFRRNGPGAGHWWVTPDLSPGDGIVPVNLGQIVNTGTASGATDNMAARNPRALLWSIHSRPSVPTMWGRIATKGLYEGLGTSFYALPSLAGGGPGQPTSYRVYWNGSIWEGSAAFSLASLFVPIANFYFASQNTNPSQYMLNASAPGRVRAFAIARALGASGLNWSLTGYFGDRYTLPTESYSLVFATVPPENASIWRANNGFNPYPSQNYVIADLGEHSIDAIAASINSLAFSLWARPLSSQASWGATPSIGPSQGIETSAVVLVPVGEHSQGIVRSRVGEGDWSGNDSNGIFWPIVEGIERRIFHIGAGQLVRGDAYAEGDYPELDNRRRTASGFALSVFQWAYHASAPAIGMIPHWRQFEIQGDDSLRPTFSFLRDI